jgi:hypothetical protein
VGHFSLLFLANFHHLATKKSSVPIIERIFVRKMHQSHHISKEFGLENDHI